MITVKSKYLGELRTHAEHVKSGNHLQTDAPVDNHGKGETFSPTDTLAAALGSCMMTVMAIYGEKKGFDMSGMHLQTTKVMSAAPRRISKLKIDFYWENCELTGTERERLKEIGKTCPVALSLHPSLEQDVTFYF